MPIKGQKKLKYFTISEKRQFIYAALLWILLVAASLAWNWVYVIRSITTIATSVARSRFEKDLLYRRWVAMYGGVYVPITKKTQPNPYLSHIPDRDLTTTSGKRLTLINPAYMIRQVYELGRKQYGEWGHVTSLKPLCPQNAPDAWETKALHEFERGAKEYVSIERINNKTYLRLMRPLYIEKPCLKCHAIQGYKEGEIRGGISVSIPFAPYAKEIQNQHIRLIIGHCLIGFLGIIGLWIGSSHIRGYTKALKEREEQLRTLINSTPDIICFKDGKGRWLEANDAVLKLFSLKDVDYRGKTDLELAELIHPIYKKALLTCKKTDEKAWKTNGIFRSDEIIPRPDGTIKIYDVIKVPIFNKYGTRKGLVVLGRDITDRKQAETERQMLATAIEQSADGIVIIDRKGKIQYMNTALKNMINSTGKEVIEKDISLLLKGSENDEEIWKEILDTVKQGKNWSGQILRKKRDGTILYLGTTVSPVFEASSQITHYVAVIHDITLRVQLEKEKKQLEEQYRRSQKLESIGRLAGGVAHDLNNLLTPILGYATLLINELQNEHHKTYVEQILQAGRHGRDMVQQLLAFSRKQSVDMKPVNLNEVLTRFEKLLRRTIREDITIQLVLAQSLPLVMGDITQMQQVIMNLAVNAQDAMPEGGRLTIETTSLEIEDEHIAAQHGIRPGKYVVLKVSDTGSGMDTETMEHIFEPFFTTKEKDKGTGLGLATVYGIVKQHKGNIEVQSEPDKGTTFKIYLPAADITSISEEDSPEEKASSDIQNKRTILLVEDDEGVRRFTLTLLQNQGFRVFTAANGKEALEILEDHGQEIGLLLTDVIMPEMNGKELFERASKKQPDLKVIYMSGYYEDVIDYSSILKKGIAFIQKPFTAKELLSKVREVLSK